MAVIEVNANNIYESIRNGDMVTSRSVYKAIKAFDHQKMDIFLTDVCLNGYKDGVAEAEKALSQHCSEKQADGDIEEVQMDFSEVLEVIGKVKGIGEKRLKEIEKKCLEAFG